MSITESRLKTGTLTLGDDDAVTVFACQATNVRVSPSYDDDGDALETLCGDQITAGKKESWTLAGTSVQDFDDPDGFLAYCYVNAMESVPFTWQPNPKAPTWAGTCVVLALEEGGDVNARLTTDWEFDVEGRPTRIYGGTAPAGPAVTAVDPGTADAGDTATITGENLGDPDAGRIQAGPASVAPGPSATTPTTTTSTTG